MHGALRPRLSFNLAVGNASVAATIPAPAGVTHVRLVSTTDCYVFLSSTGTAATAVADGTGLLIAAEQRGEYVKVAAGDLISVITRSGTGVLNVAFMVP